MENPIAIELEEESVKDNLISALDQFKPAKSDGIECPSGTGLQKIMATSMLVTDVGDEMCC